MINLINTFGQHFCRPCDRRHIVAQMAGDGVPDPHFPSNHGNTVWAFAMSSVKSRRVSCSFVELSGWAEVGRRNGIENQS